VSDLEPEDVARNPRSIEQTQDDRLDVVAARFDRRKATERDGKTAEREGLPPGYRMRADSHYVDQLSARSPDIPMRLVPPADIDEVDGAEPIDPVALQPLIQSIAALGVVEPLLVRREGARYLLIAGRKRLAAARSAALSRVPCLVHAVDDAQAEALGRAARLRADAPNGHATAFPSGADANTHIMAQVSEAVATIRSTAALLVEGTPRARRIAINLVRAEAWRAAWQLRAAAILNGTHRWRFRPAFLGDVLMRVRDGFAAEGRLSEIDLTLDGIDWNASVNLDEDAVICGVSGAVVASAGLADADERPQITAVARGSEDKGITIEIVHAAAVPVAGIARRFFDAGWSDRPGGETATIGAAAARAVAERHGGDATFIAGPGRGSTLRLTLGKASEKAPRAH
jgi:hypothetical protein